MTRKEFSPPRELFFSIASAQLHAVPPPPSYPALPPAPDSSSRCSPNSHDAERTRSAKPARNLPRVNRAAICIKNQRMVRQKTSTRFDDAGFRFCPSGTGCGACEPVAVRFNELKRYHNRVSGKTPGGSLDELEADGRILRKECPGFLSRENPPSATAPLRFQPGLHHPRPACAALILFSFIFIFIENFLDILHSAGQNLGRASVY